MEFEPQVYVVVAITILYPAVLIAGVLFIRFIGNRQLPGEGPRRSHPVLRRVLNGLIFVPMAATALLAIWGAWHFFKSSDVPFSPALYVIGVLTIAYPLLLAVVVLAIRMKGRLSADTPPAKRNQHPTLRHVLDALVVVPIGVMIALMLVGAFWFAKLG